MLKKKTSPFGRARRAYILRFMHIELAIGGDSLEDSHPKILG